MQFTEILGQVLILYIIMFLGFFAKRLKILTDNGISSISALILNITMPAMILGSLANTTGITKAQMGQVGVVSLLAHGLMVVLGFLVPWLLRTKKEERGAYRCFTIFGNAAFIGYPMLIAIVGPSSVLLGSVFNLPYVLLLYTIGIYSMSQYSDGNEKVKFEPKRFLSAGIIASALGAALFLLNIKMPKMVLEVSTMLGGATSPLAMMIVGASLADIKLREAVKNYRILLISLIKMIITPMVVAAILRVLGFSGPPAMVAVVLSGMPIATNTVIVANQYNKRHMGKASEAVVLSTLLLIATVPVLIWVVGWVS